MAQISWPKNALIWGNAFSQLPKQLQKQLPGPAQVAQLLDHL